MHVNSSIKQNNTFISDIAIKFCHFRDIINIQENNILNTRIFYNRELGFKELLPHTIFGINPICERALKLTIRDFISMENSWINNKQDFINRTGLEINNVEFFRFLNYLHQIKTKHRLPVISTQIEEWLGKKTYLDLICY